MIKAVIFDLDGTLLNTLNALSFCISKTMKHFGLKEIDIEHTRYFVGEGAKKFVDRALIYNGDTDLKLANEAYKVYDEIFAVDCLKDVKPYEGITKLLNSLKAMGIKSVVLSNKSQLGVEKNINEIFGAGVFDLIYGERAGIPKKPDPTSLNMIIEELGLSKPEILYVGDTATDMKTALRAGVTSIGVLWGFRDEVELRENKADYIINNPSEILEIIKER